MRYSRFAISCSFCNRLCLRDGYSFNDDNIDLKEWIRLIGSPKKIVGGVGSKLICDECLAELKNLIGGRCRCSS